MDTSDEFYALLHRKHEQAEKKLKQRETEKMVLARNKLRGRIELLEGTEDGVWRARMEKLLKKAARYAGDDGGAKSDLGSDEEGAGEKGERRAGMTEDELAEKVQRLVLLAGIELVKRTSAEQLKDELIREGKELLEKYNRTLGMYVVFLSVDCERSVLMTCRRRGGRYLLKADLGVRNAHSDAEDGGKVRTARRPSTELEKSETPELDTVSCPGLRALKSRLTRLGKRSTLNGTSEGESPSPMIPTTTHSHPSSTLNRSPSTLQHDRTENQCTKRPTIRNQRRNFPNARLHPAAQHIRLQLL